MYFIEGVSVASTTVGSSGDGKGLPGTWKTGVAASSNQEHRSPGGSEGLDHSRPGTRPPHAACAAQVLPDACWVRG